MTKENLTWRLFNELESKQEKAQLQRCRTRESLRIAEPPHQPEEKVFEEVLSEEEDSYFFEKPSSEQPTSEHPSSDQHSFEKTMEEDTQTRGDTFKSKNPSI